MNEKGIDSAKLFKDVKRESKEESAQGNLETKG
jgi:hypothetical protein